MDSFGMNTMGQTPWAGTGLGPWPGGFPGVGMSMGPEAFGRLGSMGPAGLPGDAFSAATMRQNQMLMQMVEILAMLMLGTQSGQAAGLPPGTTSPAINQATSAGGSGGGSSDTGAVGTGGSGGSGTVAQNDPPPASTGPAASPVNIGSGTKVLEIGDSHTVGTFGQELDQKLRSTGAQVATYASAGASASWFVNGTPTKMGYSERHADGSVSTTPYGQSHATPKLEDLINKEKPAVIVVNLGANFRGAGPAGIKQQVSSLGEIAKRHNIPIVWVGPPKSAKDNGNPASIQQFDKEMAAAVAPYGKYVASDPFTPEYSGSDGLHYGGSKGTQIAKQWADGVFRAITGR